MKLKELRTANKKQQSEVAKAINVTQTSYSYYENNKREPDITTLIKLADYFHTTVDNLIGHEVPYLIDISTFTQSQREIIDKLKELSDTNCKRVNDFITGLLIAEHDKIEAFKKIFKEWRQWRQYQKIEKDNL